MVTYGLTFSNTDQSCTHSQMRLENVKAGRKGNLNVATEVCNDENYFASTVPLYFW